MLAILKYQLHLTSEPYVFEFLIAEYYSKVESLHTWSSSLALGCYLASNKNIVANKKVLEIGAGTGIPSILCGLLGAQSVTLTDKNIGSIGKIVRYSISFNSLDDVV